MEESTYKKILLIAIDTLCVNHLGCYGYDVPRNPTTPFIDSLAEKGAIFRKHYAADVPTPSSFTSLFTGIRGIRHGIIGFKNKSNEFKCSTPLLAECFAEKGFKTGMVSNLLYPCPWLVRGFRDIYPPGLRFQGGTAEEVTDKAISLLEEYRNHDFFLFVHYWDPHCPYFERSKEEYRRLFKAEDYKNAIPDMKYVWENEFVRLFYVRKHEKMGDPIDPAENLALYDANIRYVDDNIKRLYEYLEGKGLVDETLIIVTSDHGEAFGEYGFWDHWTCYRNISQLPLIIVGYDISHVEIETYTQNIDVMPTILELAGIEVPKGLDGRSMVPLLKGEVEVFREEAVVNSDATVVQRMMVKGDYAIVHTLTWPVWDHLKEWELFNLAKDPSQVNDISESEVDLAKEMRIRLGDWLSENLKGRPDPLWLSVYRGGWMWRGLLSLLTQEELKKAYEKYPELKRIQEEKIVYHRV